MRASCEVYGRSGHCHKLPVSRRVRPAWGVGKAHAHVALRQKLHPEQKLVFPSSAPGESCHRPPQGPHGSLSAYIPHRQARHRLFGGSLRVQVEKSPIGFQGARHGLPSTRPHPLQQEFPAQVMPAAPALSADRCPQMPTLRAIRRTWHTVGPQPGWDSLGRLRHVHPCVPGPWGRRWACVTAGAR